MGVRAPTEHYAAQTTTDCNRPCDVARNEDTTLKYQPTPRDLFNPPPQAIDFGNKELFSWIREAIDEEFPDYHNPMRMLWERTIMILEEHDNVVGVKS